MSSNTNSITWLRWAFALAGAAAAAVLAGCMSGSGSGTDAPEVATQPQRTVSGQVAKGPLDGAAIQVFAIDRRGARVGTALAETVTDLAGRWTLVVPASPEPLLIVSSGGRYIDEADPAPDPAARRTVTLNAEDSFAALLPAGASSVAINIFTDALLRKSRHETEGDNFAAVFAANRAFLSRAFGFDPVSTVPADPVQPAAGASVSARQYGMALGGVANVVNAYALANARTIADFSIIDAVIDDLTDCTVDTRGVSGPITDIVGVSATLNTQILRFRNNHFAAYEGTPVLAIAQDQCARSGRQGDRIAPEFSIVPGAFTVAAVDADGIRADASAVQTILAATTAIDDRDGAVAPQFEMPDQLPLGTTIVTIRATDAAGNSNTATVAVTVADLDAPTISAPADIDTDATGPLTTVALGTPEVADNVTPAASLIVTNDGPGAGFAAGVHTVTWQVRDAAGLTATAVQTVTVRSARPVLVTALADLTATEGAAFSANIASAFADADSALTLTLTGLPEGTGLALNAAGNLVGVPTDADAQASPLLLTVVARDEASAVSDSFVLTVADVNNPPAFSVSGDLRLEEDFPAAVFVDVVPQPVPAGDPNDVTYTISDRDADFVDLEIDSVTGRVRVSSRRDANGTGSFTILADDGAAINNLFTQSVAITVTPVNDAPVFTLSGNVEVVPGFNGTAFVRVTPGPVPADELTQTVSYSVDHSVAFATIEIDAGTGEVSISDVASIEATAVIAVTADDGQPTSNSYTQTFSLDVREGNKHVVFVVEPVDDPFPIRPIFPRPVEVPVGFGAIGLPVSLSVHPSTGRLSGTPTERDGEVGVMPVTWRVTGSLGSVAEVPLALRIVDRDTDADGLADRFEAVYGTDPERGDSDSDGLGDGIEVEIGSDALTPSSLSRLAPADLASGAELVLSAAGTAADPKVYTIAPGDYDARISVSAPCENVVLVGGISDEILYPASSQRSRLQGTPGPTMRIAGCSGARIHHLSFTGALAGPAIELEDSDAHFADVTIFQNRAGAMTLSGSSATVSKTVFSANQQDPVGGALIVVGDGSDLHLETSVIRQPGTAAVFAIAHSASVQLDRVSGRADFTGGGRVAKRAAIGHRINHLPDLINVHRRDAEHYVATLEYLGMRLGRGYVVDAAAGLIATHDINGGEYLIVADEIDENITFGIDGRAVPFVIHSTPSD